MKALFLVFILPFSFVSASGQTIKILDPATIFQSGEVVRYKVSYNWGFIWVDAGVVKFEINEGLENQQPFYQFKGVGRSLPKWDWIYQVRDIYESKSFKDNTLSPISFSRDVREGSTRILNTYEFNSKQKKIYSKRLNKEGHFDLDTLTHKTQVNDVLSLIYLARCFDYSNLNSGDSIPIKVLLDNEIHSIYVRFVGEEKVEIDGKGIIDCFVFKPYLMKGTIFNEGENMTVWVSKDLNRVPILVETSILVGSIKGIILDHKGLKHPLVFRQKK